MKRSLFFLFVFIFCSIAMAYAEQSAPGSAIGTTVTTKTNEAWQWVNRIGLLIIMIVTMIGTIVTYGKKNSDQPGEFKRYVIGFGSGVAFLVIALALFNVLKSLYTTSMGSSL